MVRLTTARGSAAALLLRGAAGALSLTVLHVNDHHSHLAGERATLSAHLFPGLASGVRLSYGGYPRSVTAFKRLKADAEGAGRSVLKLHAGDAITGTPFFSLFKGRADAAMMSFVCFEALALGNHEFDGGDQTLADFLGDLNATAARCPGATAVLAANVVPGAASPLRGKLRSSLVAVLNGERVGIVGIDILSKTVRSSSPSHGTTLTDERIAAQAEIDALGSRGVNKIILLTHVGYNLDTSWMARLAGVDVIIGGDSHSLLGDASTKSAGFTVAGRYPTEMTNGDGKRVCIAQAYEYTKAIGNLEVEFDDNGDVTSCGGSPKFAYDLAGASLTATGAPLSADERRNVTAALGALGGQWMPTSGDNATEVALAVYAGQVSSLMQEVIASVPAPLCFDRFPGQGRSTICTAEATRAHGGAACQLVSRALLEAAHTADIAIQNAGGCRTDIGSGNFTLDDAYTILPFSNTLVTLVLKGSAIKQLLEEALAYGLDPAGSTGAYPYASGLRFHVDASAASGSRFTRIEVNSRLAGTWTPINTSMDYTVVTNSYIAGGKDGYERFLGSSSRLNTYIEYAEGLVAFSRQAGVLVEPPSSEFSTQSYTCPTRNLAADSTMMATVALSCSCVQASHPMRGLMPAACADHFSEGRRAWCYVPSGAGCLDSRPSRELPGAAWSPCAGRGGGGPISSAVRLGGGRSALVLALLAGLLAEGLAAGGHLRLLGGLR